MSDLEQLKALLEKRGIDFEVDEDRASLVIRQEGTGVKNQGYPGFFTELSFEGGDLVSWGAWE